MTPLVILVEDGPLAERLRLLEIETPVLPLSQSLREIRKGRLGLVTQARGGLPLFRYAAAILRLTRARQASLLHTNSLKADIYRPLASRWAGVPVV